MRKTRKDSLYIVREPVAHRLDVCVIVCMEDWPTETMMMDLKYRHQWYCWVTVS